MTRWKLLGGDVIDSWRKACWNLSAATGPFKGKERLLAWLTRPSRPSGVSVRRGGVSWQLHGHDLNEFYIAARPLHSAGLSRALSAEIERGGVTSLWDIGANIGAVSLPLLDRFKTLHVVLFEPSAEVAGRLIRNLGNNPDLSGRAVVMNVALSNSAGLTRFFVSGESENSGVGGLVSSANRNPLPVWVQSLPGDGLVQDGTCAAPQLIKIDVEGFEIEVLKGLERTLRAHHPPVLFEHSVYRFKERQRPLDEVVTYLQSLGYSVYALESNQPIAANDLGRDADWIARAKV